MFSNELIEDISKLEFIKDDTKKYKVVIPAEIWNKYREDHILDHKTVKFGAIDYQHYKDLIGEWSNLDHLDKKRREDYRARHSKILKDGEPSYLIPFTPAFFSYYFLW